jgi:hypothetical protein
VASDVDEDEDGLAADSEELDELLLDEVPPDDESVLGDSADEEVLADLVDEPFDDRDELDRASLR